MLLASCGETAGLSSPESAQPIGDGPIEVDPGDESRLLRTIISDSEAPQGAVPEDLSIDLEFVKCATYSITLIMTNNSNYSVRYGDGYEITGRTWGYMGTADRESFVLPSGESRQIAVLPMGQSGFQLGSGEFRLTKDITVESDNRSVAGAYKLHTDFAIENVEIPPDMLSAAIEVDLATPIGALINITNGFDSGRLYYDKSFQLQRRVRGAWQDMPKAGPGDFPDENMRSMASRQVLQYYTVYWDWLYGDLPAGEYRLEKRFWQRGGDGDISALRLYAEFSLDGKPVPDVFHMDDGSSWSHPFGGISTFRAEVAELVDADFNNVSLGNIGLLVNGLTPFYDEGRAGDPFYIWDNAAVAVLNSNSEQMRFSDIQPGMIVDITFGGMVLESLPAHIEGAFLIKIC